MSVQKGYSYSFTVAVVARFQSDEDTMDFDPEFVVANLKDRVDDALIECNVEGELQRDIEREYGPIPGILNVYSL
jgi:hypothetical protein